MSKKVAERLGAKLLVGWIFIFGTISLIATPNPPIVVCDSGDISCQSPSSGDEPYDLGNVPFAYSWPQEPTTNTVINVPSDMSFANAVSRSNVRVNVAAGYTGAGTSNWGSDVDVVMANTATITSPVNFGSSQRIRWTGGNLTVPSGPAITVDNGSDILVDNIRVECASGGAIAQLNFLSRPFERVAFINSTFIHNDGQYPIFTRAAQGSIRSENLIIANIKSLVTRKASRIQGVENLIVVDSVFLGHIEHDGSEPIGLTSEISSGVGFRLHEENGDLGGVFLDSLVTTAVNHWGTQSDFGVPGVVNAIVNNFHVYHNAHRLFMIDHGQTNTGVVTNSTTHTGAVSSPNSITGLSGMNNGGGNQTVPWDVSVRSIEFDIGIPGKTTLSDYGADH